MGVRGGVYKVARLEQIEAFGSPVKKEVIQVVATLGPCSIAQMASMLGRRPTSLYSHVHQLVEVGLLLEAGTRQGASREERLYRTPARHIRMVYDKRRPETIEVVCDAIARHLRAAARQMKRMYTSGRRLPRGPRRTTYFSFEKGWVSAEDLAKVNEHLDAVNQLLYSAPKKDARHLVNLTVCMWPSEVER